MSDLDFTDIDDLMRDLGEVPENAGKFIRKAGEVTGRNVKDAWRDKLKGSEGLPGAARSIRYNILDSQGDAGSTMTVEVKPGLGKQGALVWVPEFGSLSTAPRGYGRAALGENEDDFERGLAKALEDAEREAGL